MKTSLLSRLPLGAVVFAALAESTALWATEPMRLTETQMDAVTAGTVAVGAYAAATANSYSGNYEYTYTSTSTNVISEPSNIVDIGYGSGWAVACCGSSTGTTVQTTYYAEGDRVSGNSTNVDTTIPMLSYSYGFTSAISVNYENFYSPHY